MKIENDREAETVREAGVSPALTCSLLDELSKKPRANDNSPDSKNSELLPLQVPNLSIDELGEGSASRALREYRQRGESRENLSSPRRFEESDQRWIDRSIRHIADDIKDAVAAGRSLSKRELANIKDVLHDATLLGMELKLIDGLNKQLGENSKINIEYSMTRNQRTLSIYHDIDRAIFDSKQGPDLVAKVSIWKPEIPDLLRPAKPYFDRSSDIRTLPWMPVPKVPGEPYTPADFSSRLNHDKVPPSQQPRYSPIFGWYCLE